MDNEQHCKDIAERLHKIATGKAYIVNGDFVYDEDLTDEERRIVGECDDPCEGNGREATIEDFFQDWFDLTFQVNIDKEYLHCCVCIAWGGPNIYIDTGTGYVELYWWGSSAKASLSEAATKAVDEFFKEYYNCI